MARSEDHWSSVVPSIHITVIYSPAPRQVLEWHLTLPAGTTVGDALAASRREPAFPASLTGRLTAGVWGRKTPASHVLQDGDRLEIYRGLRVDPKVARRERFSRQGARSAGLFAKRREGGKAGY